MTEAQPAEGGTAPATAASEPLGPPATPPGASRPRRLFNWLLCRPEIDEARRVAQRSPREEALVRRAKSALAAANHLLEAPERTGQGLAGAHASVLYVESLYWSLLSFRTELDKPEPNVLWREAKAVTDDLKLSSEQLAEVERLFHFQRPAAEFAELPEREQESAAMLLRQAAVRAVEVRERAKRAVEALSLTSLLRIGLALLVIAVVVIGFIAILPAKKNLAAGKPWTTSSKMFDCHPEAGECGGVQTMILFHTKDEQNPWFQYDLGTRMQFSSMTIRNRGDGERARAVPLVVEVSDDGKNFREIARQNDEFSVWKQSFPKQTARFVRVRVPRKSMLHLEAVQVHP